MHAERGRRTRSALGRKFRSWLALAALLLQLAATAGHFHAEDFAFLGGTSPAVAAGEGSAAPSREGQPALPTHDDCALCFSLQLAGGTAMPDAVALPALPAEHDVVLVPLAEFRLAAAPHLLFQTRAPPVA
jgi:hypothetical protein